MQHLASNSQLSYPNCGLSDINVYVAICVLVAANNVDTLQLIISGW